MSRFSAPAGNFVTRSLPSIHFYFYTQSKPVFNTIATLGDRPYRHPANDAYNLLVFLQTIRDNA